jgi:hypothetical protein
MEAPDRPGGTAEFIQSSRRDYRISHIIVTQTWRPEGLTVNRPGRQAGKRVVDEMSAEGVAQQHVSHHRRSSETPKLSPPDGRAY